MRGGLAVLLSALWMLACSQDVQQPAGLGSGAAARVEAVSGDGQAAAPGTQLGDLLIVRVRDARGGLVRGAEVAWAASAGSAVEAAVQTDVDGKATARWTLANILGRQTVVASIPNVAGARVTFAANDGASLVGSVLVLPGTIGGFATSVSARAAARLRAEDDRPAHARDRIIVSFRDGSVTAARVGSMALASLAVASQAQDEIEKRLSRYVNRGDVDVMTVLPVLLTVRLRVRDTTKADALLAEFRARADVAAADFEKEIRPDPRTPDADAEVNVRRTSRKPLRFATSYRAAGPTDNIVGQIPNDTGFFRQAWHYNMIDAPRAWTITKGDPNVIVAVIDDGIKRQHPGLTPNVRDDGYNFVSTDTIPVTICGGSTGSYVEAGWGPNPDPRLQLEHDESKNCYYPSKEGSHGTHVAGTIAAVGTAAQGGQGVAPNVKIRALRVINGVGRSSRQLDLAAAMLYAAGIAPTTTIAAVPRAHVINMSLRWPFDTVTARALSSVTEAGSLVIAAAGNSSFPISFFPGSYPDVISVSAVAPDWQLASFSNIGSAVRLAAPGGDGTRFANAALVFGSAGIYSSAWNYVDDAPTYAFNNGTSMASPHVAGVAALVFSVKPSLTANDVATILFRSATDMGSLGRDDRYGYGVVNAYRAVKLARDGALEKPRTFVRVLDATSSQPVRTVAAGADGSYVITGLAAGDYHILAGQDDGTDGLIGSFGRRLGAVGSFARPTTYRLSLTDAVIASATIGLPQESEPNNGLGNANRIFVGSYVAARFNSFSDSVDVYRLQIPAENTYTIETAGALGSCAYGLDADTYLLLTDSTGKALTDNDDAPLPWGHFCSRITRTLSPGVYYVGVFAVPWSNGEPPRGHYRLAIREG